MGGTQSSATVNSLSQQLTAIATETVQSCEIAAEQQQELVVRNTGINLFGTYKLEQKTDIDARCFSDVNKQVELQNKIINAISQATSANGVALLGAFGKDQASAVTNLTQLVRTNVTMKNIQQSYTSIRQSQGATFENAGVMLFQQVELTQGSKIFAAATLQQVERAGIFSAIENQASQTAAAAQENPLDFIGKALSGVADAVQKNIIFFIVIVAFGLFGVVVLLRLLGSGPPQPSAEMEYTQPAASPSQ